MAVHTQRLVWLDMEMTGLDPDKERIIEVAVVVTEADLTLVAEGPVLVVHQSNALLDGTAEHPFVRKMIVRALTVLPKPVEKRGFVLGLDLDGKVIANLQDASEGNYSPITTVREYGQWLYFGSLKARHMGRMGLDAALK